MYLCLYATHEDWKFFHFLIYSGWAHTSADPLPVPFGWTLLEWSHSKCCGSGASEQGVKLSFLTYYTQSLKSDWWILARYSGHSSRSSFLMVLKTSHKLPELPTLLKNKQNKKIWTNNRISTLFISNQRPQYCPGVFYWFTKARFENSQIKVILI